MIWTCQGPEGRIRSLFGGLPGLPSPPESRVASFSRCLSRSLARTLQNCANPRKPMPRPTGIGYHSIFVPLHALPSRALKDSLLPSFSRSPRHREDLKVRYGGKCRVKNGVAEESRCRQDERYLSGQPRGTLRTRKDGAALDAIIFFLRSPVSNALNSLSCPSVHCGCD